MYLFILFVLAVTPCLIIAEENEKWHSGSSELLNKPKNETANYNTTRTGKNSEQDDHHGHQDKGRMSSKEVYAKCSNGSVCFGYPKRCYEQSKDCKFMVAIVKDQSGLYNFTLMREQERRQSNDAFYVAVGITKVGNQMENASIVECSSLKSTTTNTYITASWSPAPATRPTPLNATEFAKYIIPKEFYTSKKHMICNFQRKSMSKIGGNDFNLDTDKYKIIMATGDVQVEKQEHGYLVAGKMNYHQNSTAMSPEFMYLKGNYHRHSTSTAKIHLQSPIIICLVFLSRLFL